MNYGFYKIVMSRHKYLQNGIQLSIDELFKNVFY